MVDLRKAKIDAVADIIPEQDVVGASDAQTLVIGWGGTQGHIRSAVEQLVDEGASVAHCHIKYLNPLPKNLDQIFARYKKLIVCELNSGQLATYLQGQFPQYTFLGMGKVQGQPFTIAELVEFIKTQI
jgi:2-oxoglutarate ferredoxin oxidoreductase subunit alpha